MDRHNIGSLPVMDGKAVKGIVTERDIVRKVLSKRKDLAATKARDIMSQDVKAVGPEESILTALKMMNLNHFRHLVVVEKRRVVGIISATDLIRMSAY